MKYLITIIVVALAALQWQASSNRTTIRRQGEQLDRMLVFPTRLAGPPSVVPDSHPGFVQFASRYASVGAGDLKQLVVYSNAAFAVFEHNIAVLPLGGTTFAPKKP